MMLNTLRFKSSVLFGIHVLLNKSLRVLQVPTHLSNLIENGSSDSPDDFVTSSQNNSNNP